MTYLGSVEMIVVVMIAALLTAACSSSPRQNPVPEEDAPPELTEVEYAPSTPRLRRLTDAQYREILARVFGPDLVLPSKLEPDVRIDGFYSIGAAQTTISPRGVELYEEAAFNVAEQVFMDADRRKALMPCAPKASDDADCARQVIASLGKTLWRHSLTDAELQRLVTIFEKAHVVYKDFHKSLTFSVAGLLQSPKFLYRIEQRDKTQVDDMTLATRLSFFFWNSTPDDELINAAERGDLSDPVLLEAQVDRMIKDDRIRQGVSAFFTELYRLDELDDLVKAPEIFPHMSADVAPSAREETLRMVTHLVVDERGDYRDVLTTRRTFLNRKLAAIYNVPAPAREGFAMTTLPKDGPRAGLLGQVSFLAGNSHPVSTSVTLRGMFVRKVLLCQEIPPPPADVDTSIPEPSADAPTLRERLKTHLEVESCASCHRITDPIGLGLERFDGLGRYRQKENGVAIDTSGELDGMAFKDAAQLGRKIGEHPMFGQCMVRQLMRYGLGQKEKSGQLSMIQALDTRFALSGYDTLSLMKDVALSPVFRRAVEQKQEDEQ